LPPPFLTCKELRRLSSIFDYRPQLEYTLKDINSINNIDNRDIQKIEPYIDNSTPNVISKIFDMKTSLEEARKIIDGKLKDTTARVNIALDDILKQRISSLPDASKLINDDIITYQLYDQIKDDPIMAPVADAWDEYQTGINGSIEAELAPYVDEIDNLLTDILYFIENAILSDETPEALADMSKLRESELDEIERYLKLQQELSASDSDLISVGKQYDVAELRLNYKRNLNAALLTSMPRIFDIIQDLCDVAVSEFHQVQYTGLTSEMKAIKDVTALGNTNLKAIIYTAFADQYQNVMNARRNHAASANTMMIDEIFTNAVINSRLYKDVAIKSMTELMYTDPQLNVKTVGNVIINGLDKMSKSYERSVLDMKNTIESTITTVGSLTNKIYEKYKTRTMYKSLSN
jgi:hypothetical protein